MKAHFRLRWLIWGMALTYLILDLFVVSGSLRKRIDSWSIDSPASLEQAKKSGVVAVVHGRPITAMQLDRACHERVWLEGTSWSDLDTARRKGIRQNCLTDLIDQQLLRTVIPKSKALTAATEEQIQQRVRKLADRFVSAEEMMNAMNTQGISGEKELRLRAAAEIEQDHFIELQLLPLIAVSDQEAKEFYKRNKTSLARPAMVKLRHVFWATLGKESDAVKAVASGALAALQAKQKTFEQLAAEMSEDERSKSIGGTLGWITTERLPSDFTAPVFAMAKNQPEIFASKIGWHLVEVLDKRDLSPRSFEECREEIIRSLANVKRKPAINKLRESLRAEHHKDIHVFQALVDSME
jgi:peptidyl-prolyl cis-trans isomerase C